MYLTSLLRSQPSKALSKAPPRARKGKLAGLLAIGTALCLLASIAKTNDSVLTIKHKKLTAIDYQIYALEKLRDYKQFGCLVALYDHESNWRTTAHNGSHYNIPQGNSLWLKTASGYAAIDWGIKYIQQRYTTPCVALNHWKRYGWH